MGEINKVNNWERSLCIVCKMPLSKEEASAGGCYCEKHKYLAEKDMETIRKAEPKQFVPIVSAVIEQAMNEYRSALQDLYKNPIDEEDARLKRSERARQDVFSSEREIKSEDFAILSMGVADPDTIIKITRAEVAKDMADKIEETDGEEERAAFVASLQSSVAEYAERIKKDSTELEVNSAELVLIRQQIRALNKEIDKLLPKERELHSITQKLGSRIQEMKAVRKILREAIGSIK